MTLHGETFTEVARRMLTSRHEQGEFTLSRAGLEVLVCDSERYAEVNRKAVEEHLRFKRMHPDPLALDEQVAQIAARWPGAELLPDLVGLPFVGPSRWLRIPGVQLPDDFVPRSTTIWIGVPEHYPGMGPHRFFTDPDVRFRYGGLPENVALVTIGGRELIEFFWVVKHWSSKITLRQYVSAMLTRFDYRDPPKYWDDDDD